MQPIHQLEQKMELLLRRYRQLQQENFDLRAKNERAAKKIQAIIKRLQQNEVN